MYTCIYYYIYIYIHIITYTYTYIYIYIYIHIHIYTHLLLVDAARGAAEGRGQRRAPPRPRHNIDIFPGVITITTWII